MTTGEEQGWLAQYLRVTLFPAEKVPGSDTLWRQLTGKEPESDENRPREEARRQFGPYENGQLSTVLSPGRVDVIFEQPSNPTSPFLGAFDDEASAFAGLVSPWVEKVDWKVLRVAFAGNLFLPTQTNVEGFGRLSEFVPTVTPDPERVKEITYQANFPITGKQGIEFNRINTWSIANIRVTAGSTPTSALTISDQFFLRFVFDYNTPAERSEPLEKAAILPIFSELVELVKETTLHGEVPR